MGLIETVWEHVSLKSAALLLTVFFVLRHFFTLASEEARLRRLNGAPHGQRFPTKFPFSKGASLAGAGKGQAWWTIWR